MISHTKIAGLAAIALLAVVQASCAASFQRPEPIQVAGIAMEPELKKGDRILITNDTTDLKRGDIVTYHYPLDETQSFISRVIGLPNEEIELREREVFIDGKLLLETYVASDNNRALALANRARLKIPTDRYFVMGDNRDNSNDSRAWGPLQKRFIYGKFIRKD